MIIEEESDDDDDDVKQERVREREEYMRQKEMLDGQDNISTGKLG